MTDEPLVRAAGGVVWRNDRAGGVQVLVVHRPRYDDWSLPKGKCDPGESFEDCARREVWEETGLRCELGADLGEVRYRDHKGRPKVVRYWAMQAPDASSDGDHFEVNDEVDEVRWVQPADAPDLLTYAHDQELPARADLPG